MTRADRNGLTVSWKNLAVVLTLLGGGTFAGVKAVGGAPAATEAAPAPARAAAPTASFDTAAIAEIGSKLDNVAKDVGDVKSQLPRIWEAIGKNGTATTALGDRLDAKIDAKTDGLTRRIDGIKDRDK